MANQASMLLGSVSGDIASRRSGTSRTTQPFYRDRAFKSMVSIFWWPYQTSRRRRL